MLSARDKALNTVKYLKIADSCIARLKEERTLNVAGETDGFDRLPAVVAARMALRTALENGCTNICVHQGAMRKADFDVMTLVAATRRMTGGVLHAPSTTLPANYATLSMAQLGNTLDTTRPYIAVPSFTAVSDAPAPAAKETPHGEFSESVSENR